MARKWEAINLLDLYSKSNHQEWLAYLQRCVIHQDVLELTKTRYGLQVGMDNLVKQKMDSEKIINQFLAWQKGLDNAMKMILRHKYPSPLDDPKGKNKHTIIDLDMQAAKRKRDQEFEEYLKKSSF